MEHVRFCQRITHCLNDETLLMTGATEYRRHVLKGRKVNSWATAYGLRPTNIFDPAGVEDSRVMLTAGFTAPIYIQPLRGWVDADVVHVVTGRLDRHGCRIKEIVE
jgi:hypothetical protein